MTLQVGDRLRDRWRTSMGEKGRLWHVRGFVDDQVVLRTWSRLRQTWLYELTPRWSMILHWCEESTSSRKRSASFRHSLTEPTPGE